MKKQCDISRVRQVSFVYRGTDKDVENFFVNAAKEYINNIVSEAKAAERIVDLGCERHKKYDNI